MIDSDFNKVETQQIIDFFKKNLNSNFYNKIDENTIKTLSNMLALYFLGNKSPQNSYSKEAFIDACQKRIHIYLGPKVIESHDFATSFTLFSAAIAETETYTEDINNKVNKVVTDNLSALLEAEEGIQSSKIKERVVEILGREGEIEEKIRYIVNNKSQLLSKDFTNEFSTSAKGDTLRLVGSSFAVACATFVVGAFLGPVALGVALPLAYFGLSAGGKVVDQAEKMLNKDPTKQEYLKGDLELDKFLHVLEQEVQKTKHKEIIKEHAVPLEPITKEIASDIKGIVGTLSQAKSKEAAKEQNVNFPKKDLGNKGRGM
jgi:Uncharacterized RP853